MTTFRRLPIRLRLTMAFAGVLTTVVVAGGVLLYSEFARDLDDQIDRDLDTRLVQLAALAAEEQDPERVLAESGVEVAQVYGDDGRLLASTPAVAGARLLDAGQVRGAAPAGPLARATAGRWWSRISRAQVRSSVCAACSRVGSTTGHDWSIAFGLPGKFTISVRPRTPDTPRVRIPSGVWPRASERIVSA